MSASVDQSSSVCDAVITVANASSQQDEHPEVDAKANNRRLETILEISKDDLPSETV